MNMTQDDLIRLHLEASPEAKVQLNDALRQNPGLRRDFAAFLIDEEVLVEELKMEQIDSILHSKESETQPPTAPGFLAKGSSRAIFVRWAVAAMVVLGVLGTTLWKKEEGSSPKVVVQDGLGKVERATADAEWEGGFDPSKNMQAGVYALSRGRVQLKFHNGVELQVQAPAEFELLSGLEMKLSQGSIRASVPKSGHGFSVVTKDVRIRDIGTAFGVMAGDTTELHVFSGEVELHSHSGAALELVRDGFAARWSNGSRELIQVSDEQDFLNAGDISYGAWRAGRERTLNDRDLVFYSNFSEFQESQGAQDPPETQGSPMQPKQMRLVQGRWRETSAMLLDGPNDWASYEFEPMDSFAVGMWVKIDRYDGSLQTLVNSEGWGHGGHHLQITRDGALRVGFGGDNQLDGKPGFAKTFDAKLIQPGSWAHVLFSYNGTTREIAYYVDGELVGAMPVSEELNVNLGKSHIGAWKSGNRMLRGLRGRIDEFVVYRRSMTSDEAKEEFLQGDID